MVRFKFTKITDCMGFPRFEYKVKTLNHEMIDVFKEFGKINIYEFSKSFVKMTSRQLEISGILFGDLFIATFKNKSDYEADQRKLNSALFNLT